jgi:hypothetical protein
LPGIGPGNQRRLIALYSSRVVATLLARQHLAEGSDPGTMSIRSGPPILGRLVGIPNEILPVKPLRLSRQLVRHQAINHGQ